MIIWGCLPQHAKTRSERKRSTVRSNGHDGGKGSVVERGGQDKARKTSWPSTAADEVPGCDGSSVPPEPGFLGRESGIAPVQRRSHFKNVPHRLLCATHPPNPNNNSKSCGDWGEAKQQVEVTTGSCSFKPARRRPGGNSRSSSEAWDNRGVRRFPGRLSSPF